MIIQPENSFGTATLINRFKERGRDPRVYESKLLITNLTTSSTSWNASGSGSNSLGPCSFTLDFDIKSQWYKIECTIGGGLKLIFDTYGGIRSSILENEVVINWDSEITSTSPVNWNIEPGSQIRMFK